MVATKSRCPTCHSQGLAPAFFCSQNCFETGWDRHSQLHLAETPVDADADTYERSVSRSDVVGPMSELEYSVSSASIEYFS